MNKIVIVIGALVALPQCGGQATTGSNPNGPDASASSSGGGSSGGSSGGVGSSGGGSSGVGSSGGSGSGSSGANSSGGVGPGSSSGGNSGGVGSSSGMGGSGSNSGSSGGTSSSSSGSSGGTSSGGTPDGGCLGLSTFDGGPRGTPAQHRAQAAACAPNSEPCGFVDGGAHACSTDADCVSDGSFSPYSTCLHGQCSIDHCLSDSDCASTEVCSCSAAYYGGNACPHPNLCVPANCHVDSDCGPGGFCSPTAGYCGIVEGFYCHQPTDPCFVPTDCGGMIPASACVYSSQVGAFCCSPAVLCAG